MDYERVAQELATNDSMKNWQDISSVAIWLRQSGRCAYCRRDMLESFATAYHASCLDHLLPVSKYPEVHEACNRVLACRACNALKSDWDPNSSDPSSPPIYSTGEIFTDANHSVLLDRVRSYVMGKKMVREVQFQSERELILRKLSSLIEADHSLAVK